MSLSDEEQGTKIIATGITERNDDKNTIFPTSSSSSSTKDSSSTKFSSFLTTTEAILLPRSTTSLKSDQFDTTIIDQDIELPLSTLGNLDLADSNLIGLGHLDQMTTVSEDLERSDRTSIEDLIISSTTSSIVETTTDDEPNVEIELSTIFSSTQLENLLITDSTPSIPNLEFVEPTSVNNFTTDLQSIMNMPETTTGFDDPSLFFGSNATEIFNLNLSSTAVEAFLDFETTMDPFFGMESTEMVGLTETASLFDFFDNSTTSFFKK